MPNSADQVATVRLVSAAGQTDGRYHAGIDLSMLPGSHTYWKMPGEAGVPPVFAFNGSVNVASAEVQFPVPSRITEQGLDAFGYTGQVVFPVTVIPQDRSKPSTLHVDATFAVCNRICIPGHAVATLEMAPRGAGESPGLVASALAAVPRPADAAERGRLALAHDSDVAKPQWTVTWTGAAPLVDIFADAPEGFYFATKRTGPATWSLTAAQSVSTQTHTSVPVSLVLKRDAGSLIVPETLDVGPPGK